MFLTIGTENARDFVTDRNAGRQAKRQANKNGFKNRRTKTTSKGLSIHNGFKSGESSIRDIGEERLRYKIA
jgi:hypothetical protein